MTLTHILVFAAASVLYLALLPQRARAWALFAGSVAAIYWLQPLIRIRTLDFIFPTATLGLVVLSWLISRAPDQRWTREDSLSAGLMGGLVLLLSFERYIVPAYRLTPSTPPAPLTVALWVIGALVVLVALDRLMTGRENPDQPHPAGEEGPKKRFPLSPLAGKGPGIGAFLIWPAILLIVVIFAILKTEALAKEASRLLREWQGQPASLASASELGWLGFSYVSFRLIHTLRDRQSGKLPVLTLREYVTYAIFFPAFTAGPIDRAERFLPELRALPGAEPSRLVQGGMRIVVGIGKKFVIADSLAYMALNATKAGQVTSTGGLWVLLYAYAFRLYFDFSGYSDIAIGIGQLFGIKLPENFSQPYLKRNITQFWQSWHITLSQWVRFYVFMPLSRFLLTRKHKPSPTLLALIGQMATMIVIGLWHGVTWGFIAWGLWHGVGLFIHKVWSDRTRPWYLRLRDHPRLGQAIGAAGVILTFHYVVIGWVWFALPEIGTSWHVFLRLFGM